MTISHRQINLVLFLAPACLLGFGYYMQYVDGLEPCPLCMTQRIAFYLIAITAFIGIFNSRSAIFKNILASLGALFSITGLAVAGRQLWLQSLPEDQVPACGPSFDYIMDTFPILDAISIMFRGTGSCAEVVWTFMGLSIPGWAFVWFLAFLGMNVLQLFKKLPVKE